RRHTMHREPHATNAALMARRHAAVPRGVGQAHPIFIAKGRNAEMWDVEGKRYIDFAGGIAVLNTGHCHPAVLEAVKQPLELLTLGLTGKVAPYKTGFGPFPGEVFHALFPNPLHGVSVDDALASVETILKNDIEADRVAAFVLEPVQGEGGFYIAPPAFIEGLKKIADRHDILLIADEVQSGAGRTGTWFASEQWTVAPDLIATAKSLAGGFPISGVVGRADVMDAPAPGGLGGTYAGSPVACAAALAVLKVFEDESLLERSKAVGARLVAGLRQIAQSEPAIRDVRGLGAMVAIELFDGETPDA